MADTTSSASSAGRALITGASSGIGLELAKIFAARRYDLVLVARSKDKLEELAAELKSAHGIDARVLVADLAQKGAPDEIARALESQGLAVDVLVNNAGFGATGPFWETDLAAELEMIQVNIAALVHLTKRFVPGMKARGRGRIMNVASTAAFFPGPFMSVYYASKAFVLSFSEAMALELEGTGVTVSALCPGPTESGFSKVAGNDKSNLFKRKAGIMDARTVAEIGFDGLMAGKTVVVTGFMNRVMAGTSGLVPRKVSGRVAKKLNQPAEA